MVRTVKRPLIFISVIWLAVWGYVGWRGYELTSDAQTFVNTLPPGAIIPQAIFTALDAGYSYMHKAVIWGAALPLCLLVFGWAVRPLLGKRSSPAD
jgi:hypothetical protein